MQKVKLGLSKAQIVRHERAMKKGRSCIVRVARSQKIAPNTTVVVSDSDAHKIKRAVTKGVGFTVECLPCGQDGSGFLNRVARGVQLNAQAVGNEISGKGVLGKIPGIIRDNYVDAGNFVAGTVTGRGLGEFTRPYRPIHMPMLEPLEPIPKTGGSLTYAGGSLAPAGRQVGRGKGKGKAKGKKKSKRVSDQTGGLGPMAATIAGGLVVNEIGRIRGKIPTPW